VVCLDGNTLKLSLFDTPPRGGEVDLLNGAGSAGWELVAIGRNRLCNVRYRCWPTALPAEVARSGVGVGSLENIRNAATTRIPRPSMPGTNVQMASFAAYFVALRGVVRFACISRGEWFDLGVHNSSCFA
jgi:hypothetical protein